VKQFRRVANISVNMSEESDNDSDISLSTSNILMESEQDELPLNMTTNPIDEDNQFIYDEDLSKLICIGSHFDDIPLSILHDYSLKTKVNDKQENNSNNIYLFIYLFI
jgi:hypothetical protein